VAEKKTRTKSAKASEKKVSRYTYESIKEPRTPETGHTSLLPADEQVVTLPMDNGWSKEIILGKLSQEDERTVVVDMDPTADPVLFWSRKRNRREVPVLPLQRNEIVSESRVAQIIERAKAAAEEQQTSRQENLFADLERSLRESEKSKRVEFYTHEEGWKNKLICGDSLHVAESLMHYEKLRGQVQMIYLDPPYGIKYDSNFQQRIDSTENNEKDKADDIIAIKAFRDTWLLGVHSYLSYLQERLYLCRELLSATGSIFVQIGDKNQHLLRALLDEVFGASNFVVQIILKKTPHHEGALLEAINDHILWYAKDKSTIKYRPIYKPWSFWDADLEKFSNVEIPEGSSRKLTREEKDNPNLIPAGARLFRADVTMTQEGETSEGQVPFVFQGKTYYPGAGRHWRVAGPGRERLAELGRLIHGKERPYFKLYYDDSPVTVRTNIWDDLTGAQHKQYVVETNPRAIARCLLMSTDPGDLVFDPTCGSGTTAYVAERYGRRWITCDTSRVAINVARRRLLSSVFEHFQTRNGQVSGNFLYKTVNSITLSTLAYDREPETIDLFDQPKVDKSALRVAGPFEVMSLGRYSVEDWKGYVLSEAADSFGEPAKLENYIEVISRLYRKDAAIQGATGLVHAIAESDGLRMAISIGPLSGRVTAKQINDAVQDALASGVLEVHVLGWAFEANVGEMKSQLEKRGRVKVELVMIRPDTLAEGLKITKPESLFSPLALPDVDVSISNDKGNRAVTTMLRGVAVFDRKTRGTEYKSADSGYVAAWYLDEDYDGDCFVDCQMFFDFKKAPNLKDALRLDIAAQEFKLQTTSHPFQIRGYKRIAVKVVDVFGNESTVVRDIG
jgi:adenine-specific DNA-methyltransferase